MAFRVSPFCDDPSLQTAAAENPAEEELLSTLRFKMQGCNLLIADSGILSFFFFFFMWESGRNKCLPFQDAFQHG